MMNEEEFIKEVQGELQRLDKLPMLEVPSIQWFEAKVLEEKKNSRKALVHDLLLFGLFAITILSIVIMVFYFKPNVFFVIQGVVTLLLPFIVLFNKGEKVTE